jgi:uncharacterized YigZ family protein
MIVLAGPCRLEQEVKKSRFVAAACRVDSPEEAMARLGELRDPEANHNCWAYRVGDAYRFSDDGEPGGTAGRPILAAIDGQKVDHTLVVVTRFFGGVKLGAGGLARAYGGCAASCLREAPKIEVLPKIAAVLRAPFDAVGAVYPLLERFSARKMEERFTEAGVEIDLEVEESRVDELARALADATRGRAGLAER